MTPPLLSIAVCAFGFAAIALFARTTEGPVVFSNLRHTSFVAALLLCSLIFVVAFAILPPSAGAAVRSINGHFIFFAVAPCLSLAAIAFPELSRQQQITRRLGWCGLAGCALVALKPI